MNISRFYQTNFPLQIAKRSELSSEELSAFFASANNDITSIGEILNNSIIPLATSLPDFDPNIQPFDGKTFYVDSEAEENKDNGFFYNVHPSDSGQNRPTTVYETFLYLLQHIANIENGLREGVAIGTKGSPVTIDSGAQASYPWPYLDSAFDYLLYFENNEGYIEKLTDNSLTVQVDTSTSPTLIITNDTDAPISLWGYIWHPVFTF